MNELDKFKNKYKFDKEGNVYSLYSTGRSPKLLEEPKQMKCQQDSYGYERYTLRDNNKKQYTVFRHKIVLLENGIYPEEHHTQVNHIDGNPLNNVVENLEWCTGADNIKHKEKCKGYSMHSLRKLSEQQITEIREKYIPYEKGKGIESLAKEYEVSYSVMRDIVQNNTYKDI